jgi:hypothetical protein
VEYKQNEGVLRQVNNQALIVDLHKSEDMLAQHPKAHLLKAK